MKLKFLSVLISGILFLSSGICVFAQAEIPEGSSGKTKDIITERTTVLENEAIGEKTEGMGNVGLTPEVLRGSDVPTSKYDWSKGSYSIAADTSMDTWMYTNYYFTDFTDATLKITAYASSGIYPRGDVDVYIYRKELLADTLVYSDTVSAGKTKTFTLSNYSSDKKYYVKFSGVMNISGSFSKN